MSGSTSDLTFIVQFKNEASAALKDLQTQIAAAANAAGGLASAHTAASAAATKHTASTKESADSLREASYAARLLSVAHSELAIKLNQGAQATRGLGLVLGEISPMGLAAAGVIGLIGEQAIASVVKFAEFQNMGVRLNATLKAIGQDGKLSFNELMEAADKVGNTTLFNPESIAAGGVQLAKVASITGEEVTNLLPKLADMAAYMGTGVPQAASMLTRMLQNPTQGIMYLQRVTRDVTAAEREHVKEMMASGDYEGARQVILDNLTRKTQGFAESMKGGLAGAFHDMTNQMRTAADESERWLGGTIADALGLEGAFLAVANSIRAVRAAQAGGSGIASSFISGLNPFPAGTGSTLAKMFGPLASAAGALNPFSGISAADDAIRNTLRPAGPTVSGASGASRSGWAADARSVSPLTTDQQKAIDAANALSDSLTKLDKETNKYSEEQALLTRAMNALKLAGQEGTDQYNKLNTALAGVTLELKSLQTNLAEFSQTTSEAAQLAGMTKGDQDYQKSLETAAKAAAKDAGAPDAWRDFLNQQSVVSAAQTARDQMVTAQFQRAQQDFQADWQLMQQAMQPGLPGQQANARLETQKWSRGQFTADQLANPSAETQNQLATHLDQLLKDVNAKNAQENEKFYQQQVLTNQNLQTQINLMTGGSGSGTNYSTDPRAARGMKDNNPLNLSHARGQTDVTGLDGQFNQYGDMPTGIASDLTQLLINQDRGFDTVAKAVTQWVHDPKADLTTYIADVAKAMGVSPDQKIDLRNPAAAEAYFRGAQPHESGPTQLSAADIQLGVAKALGLPGAPGSTPMSESDAKTAADAMKQAAQRAAEGLDTYSGALARLLPLLQQQSDKQAILNTLALVKQTQDDQEIAAAIRAGGAWAGLQQQWEIAARNLTSNPTLQASNVAAQRDKYAASNAQTNATGTYTLNQDTASKNFQAGISMMSDMDQQIQKQMFDLQQLANEGKIVQGSEDWNARAQAIRDNAEATERLKESMGPLTQYVKEASDTWKTMQDLAVTAFNDIGSAIADVASGATTAHDALVKVIQDLAKMAAQAAFKSIAGSLLGSALGGGGGGGLFSSLFGGGGVVDSGTWTLADGGVMSPWGKLPLNAYSGGGVANSPQMAVFGEGRMNEAYVPLPDGKSIPVSLKGGSGGSSIQNNFEINVAVGGGPGGAAPGSSGGQGPNPQQIGEAVAAAMRNSVVQIIQDQLRTGGALNPSMG